uniref:Ig-like domain-containing protein n=1 Tax=Denticeps clupeoides TaxID=299321 RepID=A0AAY4DDM5_9TELE
MKPCLKEHGHTCWQMLDQGERFVSSHLHGSVTLPCSCSLTSVESWVWLKYAPGQGLQPIMSSYYQDVEHRKGTDKSRFSYQKTETTFNLIINQIEASDEGSYYCAVYIFRALSFGDGVFLYVNDPASEGHNVTLNCTVVSGGCAGEHSVYWFRHGTPGSHPGIIYAHGDRSAGCEKNPEAGSSTQNCVYHLPKRSLSTTEAGTYYCAVAACGRIVFGNGTKLEISSNSRLKVYLNITVLFHIFSSSFTSHQKQKRKRRRRDEHHVLYTTVAQSQRT